MMAASSSNSRVRLLHMKTELEGRLERIHKNLIRRLDADSKERAKEMEDHDVVDALGNEAVGELMLIHASLQRLDRGTYGRCERCSELISEQRLNACPYAATCIDCANDQARIPADR